MSQCPQGGPQGGTEVGLARPVGGEGAGGPGRQGPPSQALWGLVSWEAESAPSSEQKGDTGRPGARPHAPPRPRLVVLGDPSPLPSLGPHSRNQPAFLSKAPRELGAGPGLSPWRATEGKEAGLTGCATPRGACGNVPSVPRFIPGKARKCPPLLPCGHGAVWGETASVWIVSDVPGSLAMQLVSASW